MKRSCFRSKDMRSNLIIFCYSFSGLPSSLRCLAPHLPSFSVSPKPLICNAIIFPCPSFLYICVLLHRPALNSLNTFLPCYVFLFCSLLCIALPCPSWPFLLIHPLPFSAIPYTATLLTLFCPLIQSLSLNCYSLSYQFRPLLPFLPFYSFIHLYIRSFISSTYITLISVNYSEALEITHKCNHIDTCLLISHDYSSLIISIHI